jgi:hypothetical protein
MLHVFDERMADVLTVTIFLKLYARLVPMPTIEKSTLRNCLSPTSLLPKAPSRDSREISLFPNEFVIGNWIQGRIELLCVTHLVWDLLRRAHAFARAKSIV